MKLTPKSTGHRSNIAELETRLQGALRGRIHDLQVLEGEFGIILRGFARTYYAKQLAQHTVLAATGIPILANEIEVC